MATYSAPKGVKPPKGFVFDAQLWLDHSRTNRVALKTAEEAGDQANARMIRGMLEASYIWVWQIQIRDHEDRLRAAVKFAGMTISDVAGFLRAAIATGNPRSAMEPMHEARDLAYHLGEKATAAKIGDLILTAPNFGHRNIAGLKPLHERWFAKIAKLAGELQPKSVEDPHFWCQDNLDDIALGVAGALSRFGSTLTMDGAR